MPKEQPVSCRYTHLWAYADTHTCSSHFFTYLFAYFRENGGRGQYVALESGPLISNHSFVMFSGKSVAIHMMKNAAEKMNSCHRVMC